MRGYPFVDGRNFISVRETNIDVTVFEPESRIDVGSDFVISFHDIFYVDIDKVIERVNVLFDEPFDLEKRGQ